MAKAKPKEARPNILFGSTALKNAKKDIHMRMPKPHPVKVE